MYDKISQTDDVLIRLESGAQTWVLNDDTHQEYKNNKNVVLCCLIITFFSWVLTAILKNVKQESIISAFMCLVFWDTEIFSGKNLMTWQLCQIFKGVLKS